MCFGLMICGMQVMFTNRKERAELLEGLVVSNKDATVPILPQVPLVTVPHSCHAICYGLHSGTEK